jgi:hypothetical protein
MAGPGFASESYRRRTVSDVKMWVEEITTAHVVNQHNKIINFLLAAFGGLILATVTIILLQGFKAWGV